MSKLLLNKGFEYKKLDYNEEFLQLKVAKEDDGYEAVSLPHDANISEVEDFYSDSVIWYRRLLPEIKDLNAKYVLYFEGVYMDASIYVNDTFVGKWVNGYTSFWFDITDALTEDENTLYVSINYRCPNSRWYAGPGINRDVYLYCFENEYILPDSLYVATSKTSDETWDIFFESKINIKVSNMKVIYEIPELGISTESNFENSDTNEATATAKAPILWDVDNPKVYELRAILMDSDRKVAETVTHFGFRTIEADTNRGLFLNGRNIKLRGVCLHSDGGCLGHTFHKDMARRQIQAMKEMGANAIRLAHNVFAPGFLELCDEMGMLVVNEIFDCWLFSKTEYDYARFFEDWFKKDIKSWVCRDRNHPSVIFWSAGNEIYDTHAGKEGRETLNRIADEIRKYDYRNHGSVILASNYMAWENTQIAVDDIKMAGYNYGEKLYRDHHRDHPDWYIFGSETASCVQSRGIYHFPLKETLLSDEDEQCSSLGNSSTSWGAPNLDYCVTFERDCEFSFGQFLWAGIDYLGEPTPYHTKNSYFGMADTAVFPKDAYYMFQSAWTDRKDNPMIHILPYWDFNQGQNIDVRICTNYPETELFLNDVSLGRKGIDHESGSSMYADYSIPYVKGKLRAEAYEKGSDIPAVFEEIYTPSENYTLKVRMTDNLKCVEEKVGDNVSFLFESPKGDERLLFFEVSAFDEKGGEVSNARDRIKVSCSGNCSLLGTDNGDSTDRESFLSNEKNLFAGKMLAVIKTHEQGGRCEVGFMKDTENLNIRRIDLMEKQGKSLIPINNHLTPEHPAIEIKATVCPAGAKYKEIRYRVTSQKGVPLYTSVVEDISEDGLSFKLRALSDSEFRLKAMAVDESGKVTVISDFDFVADGFGQMNINPYEYVYAAWYRQGSDNLGNGNENGISTSPTEESFAVYENLDFGLTGTKKITMSIFELDNRPVNFTIWKGKPHGEGSKIIATSCYNRPSIWNVYQDQTFELDETLTGVCTLGIEVHQHKIHLKGFVFEEINRAFDTNSALDADEIYGDSFERAENAVLNIGNNVSLVFKDFDFGEIGADRIKICGHTPLDNNTIHLLFSSGESRIREIIEFKGSPDFSEQEFEFDKKTGKWDVTFIFLPGSNFDFESFRMLKGEGPAK